MSAAAPNPNSNMLLLVVLGIGAYWLMSRRAMAAPPGYLPQQGQSATAAKYNLIGQGLNAFSRLVGSGGSSGGQRNPFVWDNLNNDGYVFNNPNQSAYDWWATNGTGGD